MKNSKSLTSFLVEKPIEEFIKESKDLTLDEIQTMSNHLKAEYERVKRTKDALLQLSPEQCEEVLKNIYVLMQLMEDRVLVLQEIESERSICQ